MCQEIFEAKRDAKEKRRKARKKEDLLPFLVQVEVKNRTRSLKTVSVVRRLHEDVDPGLGRFHTDRHYRIS